MGFWKDKDGNKVNFKDFFKRLKLGIESITPLQRLQNEHRATFIMLVGYLVGLISLIIYRDLFVVAWFTYALMIIFVGATYGQIIRFIALRTQIKLFESLDNKSLDLEKVFDNLEEVPIEEQKPIHTQPERKKEDLSVETDGVTPLESSERTDSRSGREKVKPVILDNNELSISKYAEEYPKNFEKMTEEDEEVDNAEKQFRKDKDERRLKEDEK